MMKDEDVKDCPFCGGAWLCNYDPAVESLDMLMTNGGTSREKFNVICENCGMQGPSAPDKEKAFIRWNNLPRRQNDG